MFSLCSFHPSIWLLAFMTTMLRRCVLRLQLKLINQASVVPGCDSELFDSTLHLALVVFTNFRNQSNVNEVRRAFQRACGRLLSGFRTWGWLAAFPNPMTRGWIVLDGRLFRAVVCWWWRLCGWGWGSVRGKIYRLPGLRAVPMMNSAICRLVAPSHRAAATTAIWFGLNTCGGDWN